MSEASVPHHKKVFDVVFVGNFVQDTVVTPDGTISHAMGGSVTYGPLAASSFVKASATKKEIEANITIITSQFGDDLTEENKKFIAKRFKEEEHIKILTCETEESKSAEKHSTTAYKLVYDKEGCRTLTLENKGGSICTEGVLKHIFNNNKHEGKEEGSGNGNGIPDAILFVPVAGEFDEQLVIEVVENIKEKKKAIAQTGKKYKIERPIVVTDIQGFIRTFKGTSVMARDAETLRHKMQRVAPYITLLKAEYSEALAVVGSTPKRLSPKQCAILLKQMYKIPIVSVTLGPAGSFVAYDSELDVTAHTITLCPNVNIEDQHSEEDGIVCTYVPTFIPNQVVDETGSGDCFLACTVIEMLIQKSKNTIISAVETGSAATSFRVEKRGPTGFTSREEILERMKTGKRLEFSNAQNAIFTKYEQ